MAEERESQQTDSVLIQWFLRDFDRSFLIVCCLIYMFLGMYTLLDYGLTWDEAWENYYGDKSLQYYVGFNPDSLDFTKETVRIYERADHPDWHWVTNVFKDNDLLTQPGLIWPVGPMLGSVCKYLFYGVLKVFGCIDAQHMAPLLGGLLVLIAIFRFARREFGRWAAVTAALVLMTYPRWWAHVHFNAKDVLATLFFCLTIIEFHRGLSENRRRRILLAAVYWGIGLATKPNGLFLAFILGPYALVTLARNRRLPRFGLSTRGWLALVTFPIVGLGIMILCWPYLWLDFPASLVTYWNSLVSRGYGTEQGWNMMPLRYALATMPLVVAGLLVASAPPMIADRCKRKPVHLLLFLWLVIPIGRVLMPGAKDFDGIRHWLEIVPAIACFAGIGGGWLIGLVHARMSRQSTQLRHATALVALLLAFSPLVVWHVQAHPHALCYFNPAVGRLGGAQKKGYPEATDYWGYSYRQGLEWLNMNVADQQPALVVGTAEHIVYYSYQVWLDRRIQLVSTKEMTLDRLRKERRPVYLMTITRPAWYKPIAKAALKVEPIHQVKVDGGVILEIRRIR